MEMINLNHIKETPR